MTQDKPKLTPEGAISILRSKRERIDPKAPVHLELKNLDGPVAPPPATPEPEHYRQLACTDISIYEHNPRSLANDQYHAIKEALRAEGLGKVLLHVTRRPGEQHYTLAFGGGTRLQIIQELWAETKDERFEAVRCLIQPYKGDLHLRANHIIENTQRGEMCFWDTAKAFVDLHRELSAKGELSGREFEEECSRLGLSLNRSAFVYQHFAVRVFGGYEFAILLSRNHIERLQPFWSGMERLQKLSSLPLEPMLDDLLQRLDLEWIGKDILPFDQLWKELQTTVAGAFALSIAEIPKAIEASRERAITWEALLRRVRIAPKSPVAPKPSEAVVPHLETTTGTTTPTPMVPGPLIHEGTPPPPLPPAIVLKPGYTLTKEQLDRAFEAPNDIEGWPVFQSLTNFVRKPVYGPRQEGLVERCQRLAAEIVENSLLRACFATYDTGLGWYLEPWMESRIFKLNPDPHTLEALDLLSVMTALSGQWHPDVAKALPASSLWRRLMCTDEGLKEARSAVAAIPAAQLAYPRFFMARAPWGSRDYYTNGPRSPAHQDLYIELTQACQTLAHRIPARFLHITNNPPIERRDAWEKRYA